MGPLLFIVYSVLTIADSHILGSEVVYSGIDNNNIDGLNVIQSELVKKDPTEAFNGVYTECFLFFSFACIQKKTLSYLEKLNELKEVSLLGDYVKFVKVNTSHSRVNEVSPGENADELSTRIDGAIDRFFEGHVLKFKALGRDIVMPRSVDVFVGRKKKKGGGGGGGGGGGHGHGGGGDDGGKKKMMMMAMMCMKMKLMMMMPAMMGMMGMMSFKGMMFSMMSFMMAKMMLLMKLFEKKGGSGGGGGGGGSDGPWASGGGGGGGGAWMPAGGQDYSSGGGGGGGYDANGQWQSRSIPAASYKDYPEITFVKPIVMYNNKQAEPKTVQQLDNAIDSEVKSRKRRSIIDVLQNAYMYWLSRFLGMQKHRVNNNKFKYVNGVKYVYHPRVSSKFKTPKQIKPVEPVAEENKVVTISDFNKGEIVEPAESRMTKAKFQEFKDTVDTVVDDNPWE